MVAPAGLGDHVTPVRRVVPLLVVPLLVLVAVLLVTAVEPLRVSSQSMHPTLEAGDQVLVDKLSVHWRQPTEGELIVFRDPERHELVVKRVVALSGQTVAIEDASGSGTRLLARSIRMPCWWSTRPRATNRRSTCRGSTRPTSARSPFHRVPYSCWGTTVLSRSTHEPTARSPWKT